MNLSKIYKDSNDNDCNILQMVEREPEWAANRIQVGEADTVALETLREEMKAIALATGRSKTDGESDCDWFDLAGEVASLRDQRLTCEWRQHEIEQFHDTACGATFEYNEDMNWCPHCGKRLVLAESV